MGFNLTIFQQRACDQDSWEGLAFGQSEGSSPAVQRLSIDKHPAEWPSSESNHSSGEPATWQSDYSWHTFLEQGPCSCQLNFIYSDQKTCLRTSCLRSLSLLWKTSPLQVVHELSQQKMGPETKDHFSNSMLHFCQSPHKNKPSTTGETLGSLNKTNSTLSGMRYMGYETASPTSSFWNPLQPHQKYKTFAPPPKPGTAVQHTQGKSQLPHEPKASAWKKRRRKAKLFFRVITEDSKRSLSGSCALVLSLPSLPCQVPEHKKDQDNLNHI